MQCPPVVYVYYALSLATEKVTMTIRSLTLMACLTILPLVSQAATVRYSFASGTFDDGQSLSGWLDFDESTSSLVDFSVATAQLAGMTDVLYSPASCGAPSFSLNMRRDEHGSGPQWRRWLHRLYRDSSGFLALV
jgi:hypothetical protein